MPPWRVGSFRRSASLSPSSSTGGLEVEVRKMDVDGGDQLTDAVKAALADNVVSQLPKEALDEGEPR